MLSVDFTLFASAFDGVKNFFSLDLTKLQWWRTKFAAILMAKHDAYRHLGFSMK